VSRVVLYSKPGCHLCDHAKQALSRAAAEFREVDITSDPGLMNEYGITIPVVEVDGVAVFEAGMNPAELREILREALQE
jgi:glutaredoxin